MSFMSTVLKPAVWALIVTALFLSALTGAMAFAVERAYRQTHPFTHDSVSYLYHHALLHERLATEGRFAVAAAEWRDNFKAPLRTVPLILLAPGLLDEPGGHLATALPFFAVFLFLLGLTVYRRGGSLAWALGAMALPCVLPGVLHPEIGLAAYWLDLHAAFLVGGALFCLVNALDRPADGLGGYAGFALLAALAALARYVAVAPLLVLGGPLLAAALFRHGRAAGWRSAARALVLVAIVVALLCGPFLLGQLSANLEYLQAFSGNAEAGATAEQAGSTAAGGAFEAVWATQTGAFKRLLSPRRGMPLLILLFALQFFPARAWRRQWTSGLAPLWLAVAHPVFTIFVLRSTQYLFLVYALPGILLLTLAPWQRDDEPRTWTRIRLAVLLAGVLFLGAHYARGWFAAAAHPAPAEAAAKGFDRSLAARIAEQGERLVVDIHIDGASLAPLMEIYRAEGWLPLSSGLFSQHAGPWNARYPGAAPVEIGREVARRMAELSDVAVVYAAGGEDAFNNEISRRVAAAVALELERDPAWREIFEIEDERHGSVRGYRHQRRPRAWEKLLFAPRAGF